ncbi:MAG: transketolase [Brevinema sp.]
MTQTQTYASTVRYHIIDMITHLGFGHIGGALSAVDCLSVLYAPEEGLLKIDPTNPTWEDRDFFVLSKGHAGPALYSCLAVRGYFDKTTLHTLNQPHTILPSHVDRTKTPGVDMTAGSLAQGFGAAVGIAIGAQLRGKGQKVYCMVGDGELNEGQCWEAAQVAAHRQLTNLILFIDNNDKQLDGKSENICRSFSFEEKFTAFGWHAVTIDGHDLSAIRSTAISAFDQAKPTAIILNTIKGKGVELLEQIDDHHLRIDTEDKKTALKCAQDYYAEQIKG